MNGLCICGGETRTHETVNLSIQQLQFLLDLNLLFVCFNYYTVLLPNSFNQDSFK